MVVSCGELDDLVGRAPWATSSASSSKKCSKPAGLMISRIRHSVSPAFQKVCHCLRGLNTNSPGSA